MSRRYPGQLISEGMREFDIAVPVGRELTEEMLRVEARRRLGLPPAAEVRCVVTRRSLDARDDIVWRYHIEAYMSGEEPQPYILAQYKDVHNSPPVLVVGAGPAGMFAALRLLTLGLRPVILERGKDVHARKADMAALSRTGLVNPDSNWCYGEGGAGTFSDGKLYTRSSKRGDNREVLHRLVMHGAQESILTDAHPHIGSDRLPAIVEDIRRSITACGGEYHFSSRVSDISRQSDGLLRLTTSDGVSYSAANVILATGHSARDIYEMLAAKGFELQAKGFALGVRAEHPQSLINQLRYHGRSWQGMPPAEYSFVEQVDGRGVFSFCMCPGGLLVPASTEQGQTVLNGMSNSRRNSRWANAGIVVSVEPEDAPEEYRRDGAFCLLNWQRDVERRMYECAAASGAANPLAAPAQRMADFCRGVVSRDLPSSSYHPGTVSAPLHELLPPMVAERLRRALPLVDRRMRGYCTNGALLLGVESRTSSPVRVIRDPETLQTPLWQGLYPCGEGAGYSGGIVSSAIDGIRCADAVAARALEG